ncbi:MAG: glycosyltransferase [Thermoplasmata archaeon]
MPTTPETAPFALAGGVVAHNDGETLEASLRSLLDAGLPPGVRWTRIWVVLSGCTDRSVEVAQAMAARDARLRVIVEPERRGKAEALNTVFRHAEGDGLVLLNGDAVAAPPAIPALLDAARTLRRPYAVMGCPVPVRDPACRPIVADVVDLLWRIHADLHARTLARTDATHLSDELLLLSLPVPFSYPPGTINDGAWLGARLRRSGGSLRFAPDARAAIRVPRTFAEYRAQRRRIYVGHRQVARSTGVVPETIAVHALRAPGETLAILRGAVRTRADRIAFVVLLAWETIALASAGWDCLDRTTDHVRWRRVGPPTGTPTRSGSGSART